MKTYPLFMTVVLFQLIIIIVVYFNRSWYIFNFGASKNRYSVLPQSDEQRLMDLMDFDFKINKKHVCDVQKLLLLVLVSSAPKHRVERDTIRETWGQFDKEVKVLFFLGDVSDESLQNRLEEEDNTFHDIVQGNFIDSYRNMTYKSIMSMKYITYNCQTAKFILKCDDDVFVNMPMMKNFLKYDLATLPAEDFIFCSVNVDMPVIRNKTGEESKWYVSYKEWPRDTYPIYCAGWYTIMKPRTAIKIYLQAQNIPYFWIDDVFLTGIATEPLANFSYVDLERFTVPRENLTSFLNSTIDVPFLLGSVNMLPHMIRAFWNVVSRKPVKETLFNYTSV